MMNSIVFTNKAECRDCNRCVRMCPVKAIRMKDAQASVDVERCIQCGTCIKQCPQKAKHYRYDTIIAKNTIKQYNKVAVSLAPAFAGTYEHWQLKRLPSALRKLGFNYIAETSMGAYYTALATAEKFAPNEGALITTACPAVVNYIEKYRPDKVKNLAQVVSPMVAHAKYLKDKLGDEWKIIFIGPCVAKKAEAERPEYKSLIDAVITFKELDEWLEEENIQLSEIEESGFDEVSPKTAKLFPLISGLAKTAEIETDVHSFNVISVSGFDEIDEVLKLIDKPYDKHLLIEPLFCDQGCINGPAVKADSSLFERRRNLLEYSNSDNSEFKPEQVKFNLDTEFRSDAEIKQIHYTAEQITAVLEKTGNADPLYQLNCGACGYNSCNEKAIAVLNGMAEIEMCLPYVRRMAESQKNQMFESSPNGIVLIDEKYNIINMNPAFRNYFICSQSIVGKPISYLMDPDPFVQLHSSENDKMEFTIKHANYNIVCHQIIYKLKAEKLIVGIFVNITNNVSDKTQLDSLREQTIKQAQELINHQIDMAQNIAKLLGESTAQAESLVDNLMKMSEDKSVKDNNSEKKIWDIYTLK
jgi:iron only hydrogenase large subunit-like protein